MLANSRLVIVNTNLSWNRGSWRDMLVNIKASAYEDRKECVCIIQPGSPIALYHVGVEVVVFGSTTGTYRRKTYKGVPDAEYYVPCEFESVVNPLSEPKKAVSAKQINAFLGAGYHFRQTAFTMPEEAVNYVRETLTRKCEG